MKTSKCCDRFQIGRNRGLSGDRFAQSEANAKVPGHLLPALMKSTTGCARPVCVKESQVADAETLSRIEPRADVDLHVFSKFSDRRRKSERPAQVACGVTDISEESPLQLAPFRNKTALQMNSLRLAVIIRRLQRLACAWISLDDYRPKHAFRSSHTILPRCLKGHSH